MSKEKVWLRIIQINDVYELKVLPNFKTLVEENKHGPDKTLVILAGDFLGPSLLSSLDKGRGMVDTLNACGMTHVCLGNHETDVPMNELANRIMESEFVWLNTNMRELDEKIDFETDPHQVIEVTHGDKFTKKIGLMGLLTEDPSVYRPGVFGGANIEPVLETAEQYLKVFEPMGLDLVIPLTHQRMNLDRDFCEKFGGETFPIVIGGHDHEPYDETIKGSRVIKTGMDGENTAIIDITWNINGESCATIPEVAVDMMPTTTFHPDSEVKKKVRCHERILHELEVAKIFRFDQWLPDTNEPFKTKDNRLGPSNGSQVFCTMLRMGLRAQCCLINSGNIRGGKVYPKEQEWFTWSDLKAEIPFTLEMCAMEIPGRVLEETIKYSRRLTKEDPPVSSGGYLQMCDQIDYDDDAQKILKIQGKPFDPDRLYMTALPSNVFEGIDNHVPLLEWAAEHKVVVEADDWKPAKVILVETFSALIWLELGSFDMSDANGDGFLTREEVKNRAMEVFGSDIADLVVDSVFGVADLNQKGVITPVDMMVIQFVASDMLDHIATADEVAAMQRVASEVLGKRPSHIEVKQMVKNLKDVLDIDGSGSIDRTEAIKAIGEVKRRSLLM
jgi:2',3'-cyclic-nucleotide 2'-phosphodiesterase (5'-nucleotidase family)